MQFLLLVVSFAILLSTDVSGVDIYEGCGIDKECLGYESAVSGENECLEAQVIVIMSFHFRAMND